ncbi:MAG: UDP-3-O-(3-hydroxymyristoyl)glucosamine N-acyltransferase [Burkholderiales bacterium]|nr:UDP-3-O-(3-hydroxymyristoyl)glucosamine N-acyltransferase [Burkholderiales bacterium]
MSLPVNALTLDEIANRFGGTVVGDGATVVSQVGALENAQPGQISFIVQQRYRRMLDQCRASALIVAPGDSDVPYRPLIVHDNPYVLFARLAAHFNPPEAFAAGIHPAATVDPSATVAASAYVDAHASIGPGARVGERSVIGPGTRIERDVQIGEDCRLVANVTVYHDCVLGDRVIVHGGAVIGADGFGLAMDAGAWRRIPQIGRVLLGNDVEVGANTTIDRGALDDTVIEDGVKLDNQIQIGHNCRIGAHTAIAGCVGIAGSTHIGRYCRIGGSAMIGGHLRIVDNVEIGGATAVPKSILKAGTYSGLFPISRHQDWLKNAAHIRHLDALANRVRELESRLAEMERTST